MSATSPLPVTRSTNESRPYTTNHQTAMELGRDPDKDKRQRDPLLDQPSDRSWITDRLMDRALLSILLTADGATTNYHPTEYVAVRADRSTALGRALADSPGVKPTRLSSSADLSGMSSVALTLDSLSVRYTSCQTHRARLKVVQEAQRTAVDLRIAPKADPKLVKGTREYREVVATDTRPTSTVARSFRLSTHTVTAWRKEFGVGKCSCPKVKREHADDFRSPNCPRHGRLRA